jgi:hypothetical protein
MFDGLPGKRVMGFDA